MTPEETDLKLKDLEAKIDLVIQTLSSRPAKTEETPKPFLNRMITAPVAEMLKSKKALTVLVSLLSFVGMKVTGHEIKTETLEFIGGLIIAFILAQGVADFGKEANKITN